MKKLVLKVLRLMSLLVTFPLVGSAIGGSFDLESSEYVKIEYSDLVELGVDVEIHVVKTGDIELPMKSGVDGTCSVFLSVNSERVEKGSVSLVGLAESGTGELTFEVYMDTLTSFMFKDASRSKLAIRVYAEVKDSSVVYVIDFPVEPIKANGVRE